MIVLDAPTHRYYEEKDGRRREVAGVSHILDAMGKKGSYYHTGSKFYMTRGTYAHKAVALDNAGVLDEQTVDKEIVGYVAAWREFKRWHEPVILAAEKSVYCEELDYCGTLDLIVIIKGHGAPLVLDLKSGSPAPWHRLQVAAYVLAHAGRHVREFGGGLLYLRQNGKYRLDVIPPLELDRSIAEWEDLVRDFHQKESKIWT